MAGEQGQERDGMRIPETENGRPEAGNAPEKRAARLAQPSLRGAHDTAGSIAENLAGVRARIAAAAARVGRDPSDILLVAVSKTKPAEAVAGAYDAGLLDFGENYVQELLEKQDSPPLSARPGIKWHMIGHVQTNKVRRIVGRTALIHSLDSIRLAEEIQRQSEKLAITTHVLLEVNVAREESKYGFFTGEVERAIEKIADLPNIRINGLMTSAPLTNAPEQNRRYFRELRELYLDIGRMGIHNINMSVLSMGMSGDFEVAVEEGSTLIRIGTRLFGARESNPH